MKSKLGHIYLYVSDLDKSYSFYKDLLELLGYEQGHKADWGFEFMRGDTSIWFEQSPKDHNKEGYHRKRIGLNHLAFKLESKTDVDVFNEDFIKVNKIATLYETPKAFPDYGEDYYAVFFEDPDRIKLEVAYYK